LIRQRHQTIATFYLLGDLVATAAAFLAAWSLRFDFQIVPVTKDVPAFGRYLELLPFVIVLWPIVFYFHGLYQNRRDRSRVDEALTVVLAVALGSVLLSVVIAWYRPPAAPGSPEYFTYSRWFLLFFAGMDLVFVVLARNLLRFLLRRFRPSTQKILVVGAGALGQEITHKINAHRDLGFEVVGFVDDDEALLGSERAGVPVLGNSDAVLELIAAHEVAQLYIALPLDAHRRMMQILEAVSKEIVEVKLVPDILQFAALSATVEDVDGTPVINLSQVPLQGWNSLIKRAMDIAIAGTVIALLVPWFLPLVALLIWLEDRGPIFYRQERMGLDGKSFQMLKFRSMRVNAEASTGPVWAIKDDPRRTIVGGFLRRTSLDELPQAWNVLVGEMSIVGPRPERPAFVHEFKHKIPQYMHRHRVKAGITGWAQVNGWRGNTSIGKRIQYDLYYIENWSLRLDVKILWMTLRHGLVWNAY
jgi:exopolysaccharide biosynthesis polyprenyl glycosylphosphotransferase